jgi:hypothetical protein
LSMFRSKERCNPLIQQPSGVEAGKASIIRQSTL